MQDKQSLPSSCYVDFTLRMLRRPTYTWSDSACDLSQLAYCAPIEGEVDGDYENAIAVAKVDRYGGPGIGKNGGSGRCAELNGFLLKGIGKTSLVSADAPYFHGYGGATLDEGIRELIFGEVFDAALPFGAVRVNGLIATGSRLRDQEDRKNALPTARRCIIVRKPQLRLGHFMLAENFTPPEGVLEEGARHRDAAASFSRVLAAGADELVDEGFSARPLAERFLALVDRYAAQLATAMSTRLVHGGLSPSNLGLDGKWLDFGNSAVVGDHGNVILRPQGQSFWGQIDFLARRIKLFCRQYNGGVSGERLLGEHVAKHFKRRFESYFHQEIVSLAGFEISRVDPAAALSFSKIVIKLLHPASSAGIKLYSRCPEYQFETPSNSGQICLRSLFVYSALFADSSLRETGLSHHFRSKALLASYCEAYQALMNSAMRPEAPGNTGEVDEMILVHAIRRNTPWKALYRENILKQSALAAHDDRSASGFIKRTLGEVLPLIGENSLRNLDLGDALPIRLSWTKQHGLLVDQKRVRSRDLRRLLLSDEALQASMHLKLDRPASIAGSFVCRASNALVPASDSHAREVSRLISAASKVPGEMARTCVEGVMEYVRSGNVMYFRDEDNALIGILVYTLEHACEAGKKVFRICEGFVLKGKLDMVLDALPSLMTDSDGVWYVKKSGATIDVTNRVRRRKAKKRLCRCGRALEGCSLYALP
jgi:hypothetical protein